MSQITDRDVQFVLLALQQGFIDRGQLAATLSESSSTDSRTVGERLVEVGQLTPAQRHAIDTLLDVGGRGPRAAAEVPAAPEGADATVMSKEDAFASRFTLLRMLAAGGQGEVMVARDEELHREVALKQIQARYADRVDVRARFRQEAEITGRLEHPGIVPVYGMGQYPDGRPYYAMRLIRGESLKDRIDRFHDRWRNADSSSRGSFRTGSLHGKSASHAPRPLEAPAPDRPDVEEIAAGFTTHTGGMSHRNMEFRELLQRFIDVCNTLEYAHSHRILHRDIKPANIMLEEYGATLVVDWGLAKSLDRATAGPTAGATPVMDRLEGPEATAAGATMGTPAYMSPEQAKGQIDQLGPATDIYSLGATLYYILTGLPPYAGAESGDLLRLVGNAAYRRPRLVNTGVPSPLEAVCLKAMELAPDRRYGRCLSLANDVERWLADEPVQAQVEPVMARIARWSRKHRTGVVAMVLLILASSVIISSASTLVGRARSRELEAHKQRVVGDLNALIESNPQAVPAILAQIEPFRKEALPRLHEMLARQPAGSIARTRLLLALLPSEPEHLPMLFDSLLSSPPAEALLIRRVLAPRKDELEARFWTVLQDHRESPARRLRATVALAIFDARDERWSASLDGVAEEFLSANPMDLGVWMESLAPLGSRIVHPVSRLFRDSKRPEIRRAAAGALTHFLSTDPEALVEMAVDAETDTFETFVTPIKAHRDAAAAMLRKLVDAMEPDSDAEGRERHARRRVNAAAMLARLGHPASLWPLLEHRPDDRIRTRLIHRLASRRVEVATILDRLEEEKEKSVRNALILALGEYGEIGPTSPGMTPVLEQVIDLYTRAPDAGSRSVAEWLLRRWGLAGRLAEIDRETPRGDGSLGSREGWFLDSRGMMMVMVEGPVEFMMGSPVTESGREQGSLSGSERPHRRRIGRRFAIASREVSVGEFLQFRPAQPVNRVYSATDDSPANQLSWYDAAAYCNWLSALEGLPPDQWCYLPAESGTYGPGMSLPPDHLERTGYRLPTQAEWEYSCRAGSTTARFFGEGDELLEYYAWCTRISEDRRLSPSASLKPNELGLFDIYGNVLEWCLDLASVNAGSDGPIEDAIEAGPIEDEVERVTRGGSFVYRLADIRSAFRFRYRPTNRNNFIGFRVARTLPTPGR